MPGMLSDKVSLITGAGSGIGRASAIAFAREGARVVVSDVNAEGGEETVSRISEIGGQAIFVPADVSRAGDVETLVQSTVQQFGRLDCAFNNAGISGGQVRIHEYSEEDWDRVIDINLKGVWVTVQTSGVELAEGLLMTAGLSVNSRYEPKNSRRSDTQIPSSLNSYIRR